MSVKKDKDSLILHLDRSQIKGRATKTDNGFIFADCVLTRTGVFKYQNPDGTIRSEGGLVTAENASSLQAGHVGENIRKDGSDIMGPLVVTDKDAVADIESGKIDISCGYQCKLDDSPGTYEGEPYDCIQRGIRYNHVAVGLESGRAGNAFINLDEKTNAAIQIIQEVPVMSTGLKTIKLDGAAYQAEPRVLQDLEKLRTDNSDLLKKNEGLTSGKEELQAKLDTAESLVETKMDEETINTRVDERVDLISKITTVLDSVDTKKSNIELMTAYMKKIDPSINLDGKSDVYIVARFDTMYEILKDSEDKTVEKKKSNLDSNLTPREKMIQHQQNKWKGGK